jgi:hypothetical protein
MVRSRSEAAKGPTSGGGSDEGRQVTAPPFRSSQANDPCSLTRVVRIVPPGRTTSKRRRGGDCTSVAEPPSPVS